MRCLSVAAMVFAVTILLAPVASAAEVTAQIDNWTGWYAGVNAGIGWGGDSVHTNASNSQYCQVCGHALDTAQASIDGATGTFADSRHGLVGGQLGYDWQVADHWIIGIQAGLDIPTDNGSRHSSSSTNDVSGLSNHSVGTEMSVTKKLDFLGTLGGQVGYLIAPNVVILGTAGLGFGHARSSVDIDQHLNGVFGGVATSWNSTSSSSRMLNGWTAGGGIEWKFASKWMLSIEYLYYDLGEVTHTSQLIDQIVVPSPPTPYYWVNDVRTTTRFNGDVARISLNYRF